MNKPLQKLRRFFARTGTPKKYNATATRDDLSASYDEDESSNRLSGAFVVVLLLHIVALVGVFAFARIKESRAALTPPEQPKKAAQTKPNAKQTATTAPAQALAVASQPAQESSAPTQRAATPATPATPTSNRRHVVKASETLGKISIAYTVPVSELMKTNNLKSETDIHSGQLLTIPEGKFAMKTAVKTSDATPTAPAKVLPSSYIVRKNDTVAKIASDLGVSYDEMVKLNNIKNPKTIQPGQTLKVPKKN